ncbi:RHS repeat domain-containing protein, partial [Flavobacterium araucananum]
GGNSRQKVDFSYNIRGWLTGINKIENLQQDSDPVDLFAFKINYNQSGNSAVDALYNGNIAETFWKTASDQSLRSYGYQYDNLNRLKNALYRKPNDAIPSSGAYNESLSYDKNGNIKFLQRYGDSDAPSIVLQTDDLTYGYLSENSNQLEKVTDSPYGNDNKGFIDGNKTGDDYLYDANGNMISDKNKNITSIAYNQLNLPKKITFGTSGTIEYIYNAAGQKLEKIVKDLALTTYTNYLGGFQYKYGENQNNQGGGGSPLPPDNPQVPDDPQDPNDPPIDGTDPPPPVETNRFSALAEQQINEKVPTTPTLQFFPTAEGYVKKESGVFSYVFQYKDHLGNVR